MKLKASWSPEQIAGWLKRTYPHDEYHRVSHETIYRSLFIQTRGALKKELTRYLRKQQSMQKWTRKFEQRLKVWSISLRRQSTWQRESSIRRSSNRR
jgi:IS30 family transposase